MIAFILDSKSGVPIYRQIQDQIRYGIAAGLLTPGDQLPTVRALAVELSAPGTRRRGARRSEMMRTAQKGPGVERRVHIPLLDHANRGTLTLHVDRCDRQRAIRRLPPSPEGAPLQTAPVSLMVTSAPSHHPETSTWSNPAQFWGDVLLGRSVAKDVFCVASKVGLGASMW